MSAENNRPAKELRALLECRHSIVADQCDICRGRTASGESMEVVAERFRQAGTLVVELVEQDQDGKQRSRRLKTVLGIGLGITVFGGLIAWKGSKLLWRLFRRGQGTVKLLIAGMLLYARFFKSAVNPVRSPPLTRNVVLGNRHSIL